MPSNYRVQVTPYPNPAAPNIRSIVEAGYEWVVDRPTERVVSEADKETLKFESNRTTPVIGPNRKVEQRRAARFAFAELGPTDAPADNQKIPAQVVPRPHLPDTMLKVQRDQNKRLVELVEQLVVVTKAQPSQPRK